MVVRLSRKSHHAAHRTNLQNQPSFLPVDFAEDPDGFVGQAGRAPEIRFQHLASGCFGDGFCVAEDSVPGIVDEDIDVLEGGKAGR